MGLAPFHHDEVSSTVPDGVLDAEEVVTNVFDVHLFARHNWSRDTNV